MIHCIEINHAIVDGASYYKILDFINCAINGRPLPELQWKAAQRSVLNNLEGYCEKDAEDFDLVSQTMVEKSAKDSPGTESARVVDIRLVDSGAVVAMKQEHLASAQADGVDISSANEVLLWDGGLLFVAMKQEHLASAQADGVDFISTNDLIMAGLMELADSGAFGGMVMNMRDRIPGTPKNIADNYLCVVCFSLDLGNVCVAGEVVAFHVVGGDAGGVFDAGVDVILNSLLQPLINLVLAHVLLLVLIWATFA